MAHTYTQLLYHIVFNTKERAPFLDAELRPRMFAYLGGIVRELRGHALAVGGVGDHVHALISLPPNVSVSEVLRIVKANSSRWVHETWPQRSDFAWQTGYSAFTVSQLNRDAVLRYIAQQEEHHRTISFQDEVRQMLNRHGIEFDERYLWD